MVPKKNCYLLFKRASLVLVFLISCGLAINAIRYYINDVQEVNPSSVVLRNETVNLFSFDLKADSNQSILAFDGGFRAISNKVHTFYYPWYGNPEDDLTYIHWNHEYLPNWDKKDKKIYPTGKHIPPDDIGSSFYPLLGCYSSRNVDTVRQHMKWIQQSGIGVMVVSWYPPDQADQEGKPFDKIFPLLLSTASYFNVKIAFHIEPYKGRTPMNLRNNLDYIIKKYGSHPSVFKMKKSPLSKPLPVFYIYDSYLNTPGSWLPVLSKHGKHSIRGTELDGIFLGLVVEVRHKQDILTGGFDGFYTYFAANSFTFGSSWKNWKGLSNFARKNGLLFVPSVGPGYIDTRVRPWNSQTIRERKNGKYYRVAWKSALQSLPHLVSITSFNEWHEGTQIEPAVPKSNEDYVYQDYQMYGPEFYLNLTRQFVDEYANLVSPT